VATGWVNVKGGTSSEEGGGGGGGRGGEGGGGGGGGGEGEKRRMEEVKLEKGGVRPSVTRACAIIILVEKKTVIRQKLSILQRMGRGRSPLL